LENPLKSMLAEFTFHALACISRYLAGAIGGGASADRGGTRLLSVKLPSVKTRDGAKEMGLTNHGSQQTGAFRGGGRFRYVLWLAVVALILIPILAAYSVDRVHADSRFEAQRILVGIEKGAAVDHIGQIEALMEKEISRESSEEIGASRARYHSSRRAG
jgi:hypothetical protein